jgi:hypothetical protein
MKKPALGGFLRGYVARIRTLHHQERLPQLAMARVAVQEPDQLQCQPPHLLSGSQDVAPTSPLQE